MHSLSVVDLQSNILLFANCCLRLLFRNVACWPEHQIDGNQEEKAMFIARGIDRMVEADMVLLVPDLDLKITDPPIFTVATETNIPVVKLPQAKYQSFLDGASSCQFSSPSPRQTVFIVCKTLSLDFGNP